MQTMRKRLLATLVVVLLASSCGSSGPASTSSSAGSPPPQKVTIQLDWYPNPDHVGLYTGIDRGFFAAAGLDVQPISPSDVSDAIKLVAAGRVDLGISYEPELFFAQQQHIPAAAVAAMVPTALNSIIARGDRGIHSVRDLRGKTVGYDGTPSTAAFLSTVLAHAGLNPETAVHRVDLNFNLLPPLLSGKVDAIAGGFQNIEGIDAADRGLHPVIFPVDHYGVPTYDELVVIANSQRLADDPAYAGMVRRFVAALARATNWARHHQAAAIAVMRKESYRDYQNDIARSVPATLRLLRTSALSVRAWNRFGMWMYRSGLLQSKPDAAALVHSMAP
jgi:putative hydroxymethylpyrimidine transport system substrate-binding protein